MALTSDRHIHSRNSYDRAALGLPPAFDNDGWGRSIGINAPLRFVFSAGPDGNPMLTDDNLPPGVGP